jgi:rhamnose utilization protein RhaD (predicted bifunctional aldolase and dehydrogenase)
MTHPTVSELIDRSKRLGADRRNTNYAGGNTSAKGTDIDPVTNEPVELVWVKGSGGDLGTLTESGLAVLRLDRMRALVDVYPGVEREDEMVAAFGFCSHGHGGAAPSIDTAMHGLVDAPHVDHLHPDAGIAIATAADGEALTTTIYDDRVVWVPWRRPGFQLGLDIAAIQEQHPEAIGCILGGHGITAWGATSAECEQNSLWIIETAAAYIAEVIHRLDEVASFDDVVLFGGAARIRLLVRRLEELTGRSVRVGSPEAAALGNAIVQGVAIGAYGSIAVGQAKI